MVRLLWQRKKHLRFPDPFLRCSHIILRRSIDIFRVFTILVTAIIPFSKNEVYRVKGNELIPTAITYIVTTFSPLRPYKPNIERQKEKIENKVIFCPAKISEMTWAIKFAAVAIIIVKPYSNLRIQPSNEKGALT